MADVIERIIFDDSKAIGPLNNISNAIKETDKAMQSLNEETKKVSESIGKDVIKTNEQIAESTKKTADIERKALQEKINNTNIYGTTLGSIKAKLNEYKDTLMNTVKVMFSFVALSKTQEEGVGRLVNVFGGGGKAIRAMATGFNVLKVAIAATGIGALILGLTALISFFTRTQKGADFLARTFAGVKTAVAVLGDVFAKVGETMFDALSNPKQAAIDLYETIKENLINRLKAVPAFFVAMGKTIGNALTFNFDAAGKAANEAGTALVQFTTGLDAEQQEKFGKAISDTAKAMAEAARQAAILEGRKQALADAQIRLTKEEAALRSVIAANKKEAEDTNNAYSVRIEAAKKAIGTEQSLLAKKLKLAQDNVNIIKDEQAITTNMRKDYAALAQAEAEVSNLKAESLEKQIELNNKINGLYKEFNDLINTTKDKLFEIAKAYNLIKDQESFEFVQAKQLDELQKMLDLFGQGAKMGMDFAKEINLTKQAIEGLKARGLESTFEPFEKLPSVLKLGTDAIKKQIEAIQKYGAEFGIDVSGKVKELEKQLQKELSQPLKSQKPLVVDMKLDLRATPINEDDPFNLLEWLDGVDNAGDLFNRVLEDLFGNETTEKINSFANGLREFVNVFGGILNEATSQLSNIDKQLDQLSKRRETLENDLINEQELYKEGLANNLDTKQQEVDGLIAEENRLRTESEKLQKEAARRQLIQETAQQTQALITASIEIIKGFAPIPFVGLGLGVAAVSSLLAFFAKTKADAFKATKLSGGANRIDDYFGVPNKFGRSDIGNQKGYRLIDEDNGAATNVIISAREMLIPEKIADTQRVFFENLKAGMYNGYDLNKLIASTTINKGVGVTNVNHNHVNIPKENKRVRQYVPFVGKDGRQRAILQTITEDMKDGSVIEFDY